MAKKKKKDKPSVLQREKECFFCHTTVGLENHHVFGASSRDRSGELGYTVWLCHNHHNEPPLGVHHCRERREIIKRLAQKHYEQNVGTRDDFRRDFGKSYLD